MQHHLFTTRGDVLFSADLPEDTAPDQITGKLLDQYFFTTGNDNISDWHLKDVTARNLRFDNRLLERCVFQNIDLVDVMSFSSWKMQHCRLESCRLTGELFRSSVEHCDMMDVDFTGCSLMMHFTECNITGATFALHPHSDLGVGFFNTKLIGARFVGVDLPVIDHIYSRIYADMQRRTGEMPRNQLAWLNNILARIVGSPWDVLTQRWGLHTAIALVLYVNSDDDTFLQLPFTSEMLIEDIRRKAERERG